MVGENKKYSITFKNEKLDKNEKYYFKKYIGHISNKDSIIYFETYFYKEKGETKLITFLKGTVENLEKNINFREIVNKIEELLYIDYLNIEVI